MSFVSNMNDDVDVCLQVQRGRRDPSASDTVEVLLEESIEEIEEEEDASNRVPSKIYERRKKDFPCYRPGKQTTRGFFYAKIPRTGSTTMAGVARRMAAHQGLKRGGNCNLRVGHGSPLHKFDYGSRDAEKSFLWTFVREPAGRALSSFFYHKVSKNGWEASDKMFMKVSLCQDSSSHFVMDRHLTLDRFVYCSGQTSTNLTIRRTF